jgi:tetratricopeptide (TPR) repeat protein
MNNKQKSSRVQNYKTVKIILFILGFFIFFSFLPATAKEKELLKVANSRLLLGKTGEAMKSIEQYLELHPDDPEAHFLKGMVYSREKNIPEAVKNVQKAVELSSESVKYRLMLADLHIESGDSHKAVEIYRKILDSGEEPEGIYEKLGEAYIRINRFREAETPLKLAIEKSPGNCRPYFLLGRSCQARGLEDLAVKYYEESLERGCEERELFEKLAHLYEDLGNIDRAIYVNQMLLGKNEKLENKGLSLSNEDRAQPYRALTRLHRKNGDFFKSLKSWLSYIFNGMPFEAIVTFFIIFITFIFVFSKAFKFINYIALFPLVLAAGGLKQVSWLKTLAQISIIYGLDYLIFLCNYEILQIDPKDSEAWYNLGVYYDRKNLMDKAKQNYLQAVKLKPEMHEAWFMLATVQQRSREYKESEISLKKAMEFDSENNRYWYHLGVAFFNQGMYQESIEASRHSLEIFNKFLPALELFVESCEFAGKMDLCFIFLQGLSVKNPKDLKLLMEVGNVLLTSGRAEDSLKYFEETLALSPRSYETWYNFGVAQRELKVLDKSLASIKRSVDMQPELAWLHTSYGLTLLKNNQKKEAEKVLLRSLEIEPMSSYTHYLLGVILNEKSPERARIHFNGAIKLFAAEISSLKKPWYKANEYECVAIAHFLSGDREKSAEAYQNALRYAQITPETVWIFSEDRLGLVKPEEFIRECEKKLELLGVPEYLSEMSETEPEAQIEQPDNTTS